jgi:hypothetical protein
MDRTQQLVALRDLWKTADDEERYAIQATGNALKKDDAKDRDFVQLRVAAHYRNQGKEPPRVEVPEEKHPELF